MPTESQDRARGIGKAIAGLALIAIGSLGFVYRKAFKGPWRIAVTTLASASCAAGFYLFVAGLTTTATGIVGQMHLKPVDIAQIESGAIKPPDFTQTITVPGPEFLKKSIALAAANEPSFKNIRRLRYVCEDKSESFTVFVTPLGIVGIPTHSISCADGTKLLDYDPSKGFVMEIK